MVGEAGSKPVEHTADLALRVWAPDIEALFREAARGLCGLLFGSGEGKPNQEYEFEVEGLDLEELLVGWLNELLFRIEEEMLAVAEIAAVAVRGNPRDGFRLRATVRGGSRGPGRPLRAAIKAATYHDLEIDPDAESGYDLTIVFDT